MKLTLSPILGVAASLIIVASCDDVNTPKNPGTLLVRSDPPGADIAIDGVFKGKVTPANFQLSGGTHALGLGFTRNGIAYEYNTSVTVRENSADTIDAPLLSDCDCVRVHSFGNIEKEAARNAAVPQ